MFAFTGARGDRLAGWLDLPDGEPRAVVLVAHCFGDGDAGTAAAQFARGFTELGMAVLSLDRGPADAPRLGGDDLVIAAGELRSAVAAPSILVGHSLAGAAILAIADRVPEARAVATVGAPADGARERIASLRPALLVMHAPDDQVVGIDDAAWAAGVIAAWAARYLPAPEGPGSGTSPAGAAGRDVVVVTESRARPYGQRITIGDHVLAADEPAAVGGTDSGPTPYELLLASLGACTAITVRMYANRKGWPLRNVTVQLRHARIHAKDCADCDTKFGQLDHIERELQFDGELTGEQRARLLEMAERCPVHRTLHSEVRVSTSEG